MIKTLQRKFIAIAMSSMAIVLALIILCINTANYINVDRTLDDRLKILADNKGNFPMDFNKEIILSNDKDEEEEAEDHVVESFDSHRKLSAEAPYDTRYFTVTLHSDGTVYAVNTGKISAISTTDASEYAISLWEKEEESGYINNYKYCVIPIRSYRVTDGSVKEVMKMYIFLDCERELNTLQSFLFASIGISLLGLLLVFLLVVLFSRRSLKPVAESYAKQKRFITDASHEIKTPLTIIDANTEILEMMEGENEWTQSIRNQITRLTQLTEKMVFLSRMDEENTKLTMLDFSLSDAIKETAEPFLSVAQTHHRTLTIQVEPNITYHGEEASIRQLISLLLDNAIKYSTEPGEIRLNFYTSGRSKRLTVWNTVDEISPGSQDFLFDRFYRRDASRSQEIKGHGIGLSVALAIVQAHKGKITARSEDGRSILFSVTL